MKTFALLLAVFGFSFLHAQESNEAALKNLLAAKNYVFKAQSAWPLRGTVIQLNAGFDMKVMDDSINAYLPYFGRAFVSGYNSSGGINFTSTKFDHKIKDKAKGGWEVEIRPSDTREVSQLLFSVSTNGYATLQVLSNNRQAISFYGVIEKNK